MVPSKISAQRTHSCLAATQDFRNGKRVTGVRDDAYSLLLGRVLSSAGHLEVGMSFYKGPFSTAGLRDGSLAFFKTRTAARRELNRAAAGVRSVRKTPVRFLKLINNVVIEWTPLRAPDTHEWTTVEHCLR